MLKPKILQISTSIITVFFLLIFSLFSVVIAQNTKQATQNVGELHNEGIMYINKQLHSRKDKTPPGYIDIKEYVKQYFAQIGWKFIDFKVPVHQDPIMVIDSNKDMSIELKTTLKSIFNLLDKQPSLSTFNKSLDQIANNSKGKLREPEQQRLNWILSIARNSATLWAPQSDGGMDAIKDFPKYIPSSNTSTAKKKLNWWQIVKQDVAGATAGSIFGPEGTVIGAIVSSGVEAIDQVTSDR